MSEKKNFLDVIKAAQAQKNHSNVPDAKGREVQQAKFGNNKPVANKPMKKASGRGR
jgi:hypothetical protein